MIDLKNGQKIIDQFGKIKTVSSPMKLLQTYQLL